MYAEPGGVLGEGLWVKMRLGPGRHRLGDLATHELGGGGPDQRPEGGRGIGRIIQPIAAGELHQTIDEAVVDVAVHVDALDRAAGLAAVEECAVGEVLDRVLEIGIGSDVRGVLAAQLQPDLEKAPRCGLLHAASAGDRAGEAHEADFAARDDPRDRLVTEVQMLEQARGQPARGARLADPLGAKRGLRRVLQNHRVARHQCRHDGIHGGQIRIVPGRDDERNAERHSCG